MLIHFEARYAHPIDTLLATWGDHAFLRYKFARLGQQPATLHDLPSAQGEVAVLAIYLAPMVPAGPARLLLPAKVYIEQCDRWYSSGPAAKHGQWKVRVVGLPVQMGGTMSLRVRAGGEVLFRVSGQVVSSLPRPLSGWLERLGSLMIRRTLAQVFEITNAWIALNAARTHNTEMNEALEPVALAYYDRIDAE